MFFTIGTDIIEIDNFSYDKHDRFLVNNFSSNELEYCYSKEDPKPHIAARFAGKEAVIKALNSRGVKTIRFGEIEILNDTDGAPHVTILKPVGIDMNIEISLSHCKDKALAFVLIWG